jgi:hypothetical protein
MSDLGICQDGKCVEHHSGFQEQTMKTFPQDTQKKGSEARTKAVVHIVS